VRFDEVKRYLRIYDLRKGGKKWSEIATDPEVYPNKIYNNILRIALINEEKKARKVIKNVERGQFPGKY
jgi:hypothetical protein